ncbi:MAG: hypothetical protein HZB53_10130 [Chloroflexi bacterium]|nr:hypothetical protein [Chloroflexota bacterium]
MSAPQTTTVRCPQCRQPIQAQIYSIVDVGREPSLKSALLRGQINALACPQCGYRGALGAPMLYHDPAKQLALVFLPMELGLKREEEERQIGRLANALMDSMPAEQRKMYMLNPKRLLSWQSLNEEILQADGITKEMLDRQAAQVRLLDNILRTAASEAGFDRQIEEHKAEIDQSFVDFVGSLAQSSTAAGDQQSAAQLLQVAVLIAQKTGLKPPVAAGMLSLDDLIEEMLAVQNDDELRAIVASVRSTLDYSFYQSLTDKIETSGDGEAGQLKALRTKLLRITDEMDKETEKALAEASQLLQQVLRAPDPRALIAQNIDRIGDAFLMVLQANVQQATQQKQEQVAQVLQGIYREVVAQLQAKMPPSMRFINELLGADPAERGVMLRARRAELTPELLGAMEQVAEDLVAQGRAEVATEVAVLIDQVQDMLEPFETSLPLDMQFVGPLIRADAGERAAMLRELANQLTPDRLALMQAMAESLQEQGRLYLSAELRVAVAQAKAWATPIAAR